MKRLAVKIPLPSEAQQISNYLLNGEGTCTCGRVLRNIDAKLILMTAIPTRGLLLAGAYCLNCSNMINKTLELLRHTLHTGTQVAPVERLKS